MRLKTKRPERVRARIQHHCLITRLWAWMKKASVFPRRPPSLSDVLLHRIGGLLSFSPLVHPEQEKCEKAYKTSAYQPHSIHGHSPACFFLARSSRIRRKANRNPVSPRAISPNVCINTPSREMFYFPARMYPVMRMGTPRRTPTMDWASVLANSALAVSVTPMPSMALSP